MAYLLRITLPWNINNINLVFSTKSPVMKYIVIINMLYESLTFRDKLMGSHLNLKKLSLNDLTLTVFYAIFMYLLH